jgi:hypothetical protein
MPRADKSADRFVKVMGDGCLTDDYIDDKKDILIFRRELTPVGVNVYRKMMPILGITTPFGVAQHRWGIVFSINMQSLWVWKNVDQIIELIVRMPPSQLAIWQPSHHT